MARCGFGCSLVGEARCTGPTLSQQGIPVSHRIVLQYFTAYHYYHIDIHRLPEGPYRAITNQDLMVYILGCLRNVQLSYLGR